MLYMQEKNKTETKRERKSRWCLHKKKKGGFGGWRKQSGKWVMDVEKETERKKWCTSIIRCVWAPASSLPWQRLFRISHLGRTPQRLRIIKARRLRVRMEKDSERIRGWGREGGGAYRWCHSWCGDTAKRCPTVTVINQTGCWWLCWPKWAISLIGVATVHL